MASQDQTVAKEPVGNSNNSSPEMTREFRDRQSPCWDMSQERVFIETICNQRFNFFLAFFGASLIGASNAHLPSTRSMLLVISLCICSLLALKIGLTYKRLELIIDYIRQDKTHPEAIITQELEELKNKTIWTRLSEKIDRDFGMFSVYSFWIPVACLLVLVILLFVSIPATSIPSTK